MSVTYEEFIKFSENHNGKYYEAINKEIYEMSSPSARHQIICKRLSTIFDAYLTGKQCQLFIQPFDVFLGDNVVIPDLCVICDKNKITEKGCVGNPDLVIEIVSASTSKRDLISKRDLYLKFGVSEYWIVFPYEGYVLTHILDERGDYTEKEYFDMDAAIYPTIFPEFEINLKFVFGEYTSEEFWRYIIKRVVKLDVSRL